ncbi:hypothetical protein DFP72DRAFT_1059514 [Ephemerocybe angulata]|uniref:Uncharacterized protein n=1 Tax=Ephemerocybe angulata TaxID=980116 RepID=A0A8H6IFF2_9AGAR|nr:hypothetical protein DFP72DRAFT_1059514 [Tulosesus angulatus]
MKPHDVHFHSAFQFDMNSIHRTSSIIPSPPKSSFAIQLGENILRHTDDNAPPYFVIISSSTEWQKVTLPCPVNTRLFAFRIPLPAAFSHQNIRPNPTVAPAVLRAPYFVIPKDPRRFGKLDKRGGITGCNDELGNIPRRTGHSRLYSTAASSRPLATHDKFDGDSCARSELDLEAFRHLPRRAPLPGGYILGRPLSQTHFYCGLALLSQAGTRTSSASGCHTHGKRVT